MDIISLLVPNIIPLYILIAMGYAGARWLDLNLHSMAIVAIYFISPIVVFGAITKLEFQASYLLLPPVLFGISAAIATAAFHLSRRSFKEKGLPNIIGISSTNGNSGYFGLPIVLALYDPSAAGIYFMMNMFIELSTNTVGYYLLARGNFSVKDSLIKVAKLPPLHGMVWGLIFNFADIPLPDVFYVYWDRFTGAWVVIGMMLLGVALGKQPYFHLRLKLFTWMMSVRFIVWPAAMIGLIMLDKHILHLFGGQVHTLLLILGVIPHSANAVAFAAQLKVSPEDLATVVLISTGFALLFVPLAFYLMGAPF